MKLSILKYFKYRTPWLYWNSEWIIILSIDGSSSPPTSDVSSRNSMVIISYRVEPKDESLFPFDIHFLTSHRCNRRMLASWRLRCRGVKNTFTSDRFQDETIKYRQCKYRWYSWYCYDDIGEPPNEYVSFRVCGEFRLWEGKFKVNNNNLKSL